MNEQDKNIRRRIFSARLKNLMDAAEINQPRLATDSEVSQATVSRWLQGSMPKAEELFILSRYFGVTMESFLDNGTEAGRGIPQLATQLSRKQIAELKQSVLSAVSAAVSTALSAHFSAHERDGSQ